MVKEVIPSGNIAGGQSIIFNLRRAQFQDPRVREALGLMFNFEWSNKALFYGLFARINSIWENSELAATGPADARGGGACCSPWWMRACCPPAS